MHTSVSLSLALLLLLSTKTVTPLYAKGSTRITHFEPAAGALESSGSSAAGRAGNAVVESPPESGGRRRSLQQTDDNPNVQNVECQLRERDIAGMLNSATRTWTVNSAALLNVQNDLGAIISCTQAGDVVLFEGRSQVRPATRVVIPWNLTLSSFTETTDLEGGVFPRASKMTFRCPRNRGIFLVRSPDVLIANVVFRDCSPRTEDRPIVQVNECDANGTRGTVKLHHVTFRRNSFDGASAFAVGQPSCSAVEMVDVVFSDNTCGDGCFARLSSDNRLQGIKLRKNVPVSLESSAPSLILAPSESSSSIEDLISEKNGLSSLRVTEGNLTLVDAEFEENEDQPAVLLEGAGRVLVANSSFRGNTAVRAGAAILANGTEQLSVSNCSFVRNAAERGGAISSTDADLEIRNCTFQHNVARSHAGAILVEKNALELRSSVFENNSASILGGAIRLVEVGQTVLSDVQCRNSTSERGGCLWAFESTRLVIRKSAFTSNAAGVGGAIYCERASDARIVDSRIRQNKASDAGGGVFILNSTRLQIRSLAITDNLAANGGGLGCRFIANLTIQQTRFRRNNASQNGAGAYVVDQSSVIIQEVDWTRNSAERNGGGFFADLSNITSAFSTYSSNQARSGAGFSIENGKAESIADSFVRNSAFAAGGGIVAHRATVAIRNCSMTENVGHRGGGVDVLTSEIDIRNVSFVENAAHTSRGGGIACHDSNMSVADSQFLSNAAVNSGGAMDASLCRQITARNLTIKDNSCISVAGGIGIADKTVCNIYDSVLQNNAANIGGAVHNQNATIRMNRCTIESSNAEIGAAISVLRKGKVVLRSSVLSSNRAGVSGGGVYSTEGEVTARNATFEDNSAVDQGGTLFGDQSSRFSISRSNIFGSRSETGGGLFMQDNSNISLVDTVIRNSSASQHGGGAFLLNSMMEARESFFQENKASIGGSLLLMNSSLRVMRCNFSDDTASRSGGSVAAAANSSVTAIEVWFSNSTASRGGGIWISGSNLTSLDLWISACNASVKGGGVLATESSTFLCSNCSLSDNEAGERGGAVAFESAVPQHLALQLNGCAFNYNSAELGGAVHVSTEYASRDCSQTAASCTFIAVTGCGFLQNEASVAGGAIFVQDSDIFRYSCSAEETSVPPALYSNETLKKLDSFASDQDMCSAWRRNEAGRYGPTFASCANSIRAFTRDTENSSREELVEDGHVVFQDHKSGDALPALFIEVVDGFEQGPPVGREDTYIRATISSPDQFLSGTLTVPLDERRKRFPAISDLQRPGFYRVYINFSEPELQGIVIDVEVRSCRIGEFVEQNGTLCVRCSGSQYNFDSNSSTCDLCPDNGNCTTNVIHPNKGYWNSVPCSRYIQKCVSKDACDFPEREDEMNAVTRDIESCSFNETRSRAYAQAQCKKGYTGVLCGSCETDYGRSLAFNCKKCFSDFATAVLFVLSLIVLLGLSGFAIRSNLPARQAVKRAAARVSRRNHIPVSEPERLPTDVPVDFQMVEMLRTGHVPPEIVHPDLLMSAARPKRIEDNPILAKDHVVEIFKITINFLQVIATAAAINTYWNTWMLSLLSAADFLSGAASEGIVLSIDCWFSAEQDTSRSVIRTVIYLLVPVAVSIFYIAFWTFLTHRLNENVWYFAKRALLSTLVVAYLTYVSITRTAVNTLYCVEVHDSIEVDVDRTERYWAVDTSLRCYEGPHAVLAAVSGWPVVIIASAGLPLVLIYALLKQRLLKQDEIMWFSDATSFLYRAYKDQYIFWESIIMLRKAILTIIIVFCYPLGANIQGILVLCVLTCAIYIHFSCQPFRKEFDSLNAYETVSLFVSQLTFASGLLFGDHRTSGAVKVLITILLSVAIGGLFFFFLYKLLQTAELYVKAVLKNEGVREAKEWGRYRTLSRYAFSSMAASVNLLFQKRESRVSNPNPQRQQRTPVDV